MARSYEVIQSEIEKLQEEAQQALLLERNEAIVRIRADMAKYRISVDELTSAMPAQRKGGQAGTRVASPRTKPVSVTARATVVAPGKTAARTPAGAAEESPAVKLLQDAGIDFRRKRSKVVQPSAPAEKIASTTRVAKPAAVKTVSKAGAKAKAGAAR